MLQSLGLADAPPDQSLQALAALAADIAGAPTGLVCLIESDRIFVAGSVGFDEPLIDRWDSFCSQALFNPREVLWVSDARADLRFNNIRYVVGEPRVRFYAGVPLCVNGCMVGTLCVLDPDPRPFDEALVARLRLVGQACAAELAERHRTGVVRQALAASADALVDCDAEGLVVTWSEGAERLFGFTPEEAVGADIAMIIPEEYRQAHWMGMRRWRESGAARLGRRLELPAKRRDGTDLDIELWMSVSHDDGKPRVHANIRDISERRAQARELADAVARAEDASQAKTAFLANMSHELRTPLNGVTACAGLLASSPLNPDQARLVDIVSGAADQLGRLIADILDLARIEAGELKLSPSPTDLGSLVEGVVDLCRLKADEKAVALRLDLDPAAQDTVLIDAPRMKQVLGNLLSNSIKFTEDGEVVLRVNRSGATFSFEVQDTGIGFGPEVRKVIFDRFQQADPTITRRFGGTGLGLAICRDLVEAMGGVLECRSTPGEGSTFWINIDLPTAAPEEERPSPCDGAVAGLAGARVLVADDNATNRQVVGLILDTAGIDTVFAEDGREALAALSKEAFDLVLMDMMMPEMDGMEATRRLRAGDAGYIARETPLLMLTANTLPEHVAQSVAAGADGHLAKPITPARLLQAVAQALSRGAEDPLEGEASTSVAAG
ncbi:ATP-binding protein [Brevundimonas sp. GCM10030266]|uniref:ATP-binding protein n=1 Tax=Brevundimonas sp. GCM10030266 TaxID=3273386 RepID=UPI00360F7746